MNRPGVRDLVIPAIFVAGLGRFVDGPFAWGVGALLPLAVLLGVLQLIADEVPAGHAIGVPVESLLLPTVAAFSTVVALRLVPIGILLVPAVVVAGLLLALTTTTELRLAASTTAPSATDRTRVLTLALLVALVAFLGVPTLVPGGYPEIGAEPTRIGGRALLLLAASDGAIAVLLGYRVAALQTTNLRDVLWSAAATGVAIAIAAAVLRALALPRIIGPALLVLFLFLWLALHATHPSQRRDPRRIWEAIGLVAIAGVVVAWALLQAA